MEKKKISSIKSILLPKQQDLKKAVLEYEDNPSRKWIKRKYPNNLYSDLITVERARKDQVENLDKMFRSHLIKTSLFSETNGEINFRIPNLESKQLKKGGGIPEKKKRVRTNKFMGVSP